MDPVVAIPVKSFAVGKRRLASAVDDARRAGLGRALASHVAGVVEELGLIPMFVTGDPEVARWAAGHGFPSIPEEAGGLDAAASAAAHWASRVNSPWLILHSDLPLLAAGDLVEMTNRLSSGREVIAPSADGGTSAIGSTDAMAFAFGPGSFARHLARLHDPLVFASVGLLHDVDTPGDIESAAATARGSWLATYIG